MNYLHVGQDVWSYLFFLCSVVRILGNRVAELEKKLKTLEISGLWSLPGEHKYLSVLRLLYFIKNCILLLAIICIPYPFFCPFASCYPEAWLIMCLWEYMEVCSSHNHPLFNLSPSSSSIASHICPNDIYSFLSSPNSLMTFSWPHFYRFYKGFTLNNVVS